jgi:formylglycine-generating enzyme required for sulfatase activity
METRNLGDYTLVKLIGHGALGSVYLAEHRFLKRQYALKVLPEELSSDRAFIARFEEEVSSIASLDHPNIVKIHNISYANGLYFIVSDCVVDEFGETTNLAQYVMGQGKRLEEQELYKILQQIAAALDYAHSKKGVTKEFVHRGVKFNNILIKQGKGAPQITLSDFGLSRVIGAGTLLSRAYKLTAEALGVGLHASKFFVGDAQKISALHASFLQSFAFLSPEQKRNENIDYKTDVYSFGVLAYSLITGEFPEGLFKLPSEKVADLEYNWDLLTRKTLAFDAADRATSLTELLEEITQPVEAPVVEEVAVIHHVPEIVAEKMENASVTLKPVLNTALLERPDENYDPMAALAVDTTVKHYTPTEKDPSEVKPILTDMVTIPGGVFTRGSNEGNRDEMPRHQVTLSSFAIDVHPVTNEQFVKFLEVMGGEKDSSHQDIIRLKDSRIKRSGGKLSIESGYHKHPVVGVTWYGALVYAKWVGKRLPTEAEWEIAACCGHDQLHYPTGDDIEKSQANFFSSDTTAVCSYAPNKLGIYDMAGNVYEWCYDWYGYTYYEISMQEPEDPTGPLQGVYRVLRGGCWKSSKEDLPCSRRHRNNPGTVNGTYGFRCASNVEAI